MGKIIDADDLKTHNVKKFEFASLELPQEDKLHFDENVFKQKSEAIEEQEPIVENDLPPTPPNEATALLEKIETLTNDNVTLTMELEELKKTFDDKVAQSSSEAYEKGKEEGIQETQETLQEQNDELNTQLLKSITSELGVSAVALTYQTQSGQTQARLFLAQQQAFHSTVLWPQPKGKRRSWAASVAWLSSLTSKQTKRSDDRSTSVFTSPWFWGAITAAVGAAIVGYAVTRNEDEEVIHLQGRVNP